MVSEKCGRRAQAKLKELGKNGRELTVRNRALFDDDRRKLSERANAEKDDVKRRIEERLRVEQEAAEEQVLGLGEC